MGRPALPIAVIQARGKTHLTKKQIAERAKSEVKLGSADLASLVPPPYVKQDLVAYGYWKKHIAEYSAAAADGAEILKTSDAGLLAMYCKTQADYERLLEYLQANRNGLRLEDVLKMEQAINRKLDSLLKMQDRLFLNPLAKVKNVPKKPEKPPDNPADKFGI